MGKARDEEAIYEQGQDSPRAQSPSKLRIPKTGTPYRDLKVPLYADTTGQRHVPGDKKWHNKTWAVVFAVVLLIYICLAGWILFQVKQNYEDYLTVDKDRLPKWLSNAQVKKGDNPPAGGLIVEQPPPVDLNVALILGGASILAFFCAGLLLFTTACMPLVLVWSGHVLMITSCLVGGVFAIMNGYLLHAAVGLLCAGVLILSCFVPAVRDMMRRAAVMIRAVSSIGSRHPSVYFLVIVGILLQTLLVAFAAVSVVCAWIRFLPYHKTCDKEACGWGYAILSSSFILFAQNWAGGTLSNIIVASLAGGPYSEWFQKANPSDHIPPTIPAALWATMTISLGSMALNAMITDLVNLVIWILENIIDQIPGLNSCFTGCLGCILTLVASLAEKFNRYVCIVIGVNDFSLDYYTAAKRTYAFAKKGSIIPQKHLDRLEKAGELAQTFGARKPKQMGPIAKRLNGDTKNLLPKNHFMNGLGALLNDALVANALGMGSLACGVVAVMAVYVYMQVLDSDDNVSFKLMWWEWAFVIYAFFMAFGVASILSNSIEAGVSTLYVCIYDPPGPVDANGRTKMDVRQVLRDNCLELYELIEERYPNVFDARRGEGNHTGQSEK